MEHVQQRRDLLHFPQPAIVCGAQWDTYREGLTQLDALISTKERDLLNYQNDPAKLEGTRFVLRQLSIMQ
mgnify:CR=1 FL=1